MVWTGHRNESTSTCIDELETVRVKGLKRRGLSRFYSDRSQSFASLELVLCSPHGDSTAALAKRSISSACSVCSSSSACDDNRFTSRSLPISPGQTVRGRNNVTLRQSLPSGGTSAHSRSEGGGCDACSCEMVAEVVPRTWQQQAADDICTALRIRCSLGYHPDTGGDHDSLASAAQLSRPPAHREQLGALLSMTGTSS